MEDSMLEMTKRCKEKRQIRTFYEQEFIKILNRNGISFRSQKQIGYYIVDFIILDTGIVVEIDGGQHDKNIKYDNERTNFIKRIGFRIIRIRNEDIYNFDIELLRPTEIFSKYKVNFLCRESKNKVKDILEKINKKERKENVKKKLKEGDLCRNCETELIRKFRRPNKKIRKDRSYYYKSFLYCPKCKRIYFLEDEKIYIKAS
jgi:very-short-patch-repair endonuclease